jgi:hypothetical protein
MNTVFRCRLTVAGKIAWVCAFSMGLFLLFKVGTSVYCESQSGTDIVTHSIVVVGCALLLSVLLTSPYRIVVDCDGLIHFQSILHKRSSCVSAIRRIGRAPWGMSRYYTAIYLNDGSYITVYMRVYMDTFHQLIEEVRRLNPTIIVGLI